MDKKSAGAAALSGAITGAITGGAAVVKSIETAVQTSKLANTALNTTANIAGTAVGTVTDNISHDKNTTEGLAGNLLISTFAGIISGVTAETGIHVIDSINGTDTVYYAETIDQAGVIKTITTVAPNETGKDISVNIGQEIAGAVSNSKEGK